MSKRSNEEWLEALRGERGVAQLEQAHKDLANYLYKVAVNYLERRQGQANPFILTTFTSKRLEALAENFAQDTLEKMMASNLALLDKFEGRGAFTSWMAVVTMRLIADDLRLVKWNPPAPNSSPEQQVVYLVEEEGPSFALQNCLDKLTSNRQQAIWARVVEERPVQEVADEMGKSKSAVYALVAEAKRNLRECLKDSK